MIAEIAGYLAVALIMAGIVAGTVHAITRRRAQHRDGSHDLTRHHGTGCRRRRHSR